MADEKVPKNPGNKGPDGWGKVTSGYQRGDATKVGPYISISKNGAVEALVDATALAEEVAGDRGLSRHQWAWDFRVNPQTGQVAHIPISAAEATKGSAGIRWYEGKGSPTASWHIGGVFKDYPALALTSDVKVVVTKAIGPDGLPVLVVPFNLGLSTQTNPRGGETPGRESAAGEEPKR